MEMPRVHIGRLSYNVREKDIQRFFSGYGCLLKIDLKKGYVFVEFKDRGDAGDAVYGLNGRELCGEHVIVEHVIVEHRGGYSYGSHSGGSRYGSRRTSGRSESGPPVRSEFRLIVEHLSSLCSCLIEAPVCALGADRRMNMRSLEAGLVLHLVPPEKMGKVI
uniref:RRM domain-containing protein n=1 Tax=Monodon monoceros TaxID=40151 RepID=A0A8C6AN61_MONMO